MVIRMFTLKNKNMYPYCTFYHHGDCICKGNHKGGTERNLKKRWGKHYK